MTASGRPFQTWAAATGKARVPTVDSLMGGMTRRLVLVNRRARRPGRSATATRGPRYRGALSCRTLYASTAILYCMRSGTSSQCSVANASVMWSCGSSLGDRCWRRGCSCQQGSAAPCCLDTGGLSGRAWTWHDLTHRASAAREDCRLIIIPHITRRKPIYSRK